MVIGTERLFVMSVAACIAYQHNIWLVFIAGLICSVGSWTTIKLFNRSLSAKGAQKMSWHVLTATAAGTTIWCTHFIAILGYDPGVPYGFDPVLTVVSLLVAFFGSALGFVVASDRNSTTAALVGGGIVGLGISVMHYSGILAYRVNGIVSWDVTYLVTSICLAVAFSALAAFIVVRGRLRNRALAGAGLLAFAILSLHFTGMTALRITPLDIDNAATNPEAARTLALAVACVALMVVAAGFASYFIDGSTRAESVERLREAATHDGLTGLPNRSGFNERLDRELLAADAVGARVAFIAIDLDRFKEINDRRGHAAGDEVLKILGRRMMGVLRGGEVIGRMGGDEFAAFRRVESDEMLQAFLRRIETVLSKPMTLDDGEVVAGGSIGVAFYPDDATTRTTLASNADLAMYRAKGDVSRSICFYEPSMDDFVRTRRKLAAELREALEKGQLDLHYQVQTSVLTGEIRGYEALVRWRHPVRGLVPPSDFIPIAEESGLILPIGEWVLRTACATAATWSPPYKIAVNLSPIQFGTAGLPDLIRRTLRETGLDAERLELELTESTIFVDRERSLHMLREIKRLGVSIALDDFGTGYSSLDILRSFPFDKIKLDRSFMREVEDSPTARAIIRAILALGSSLKIPVLAEGIETDAQLALLRAEGCDEAQGYLLGRPAPLDSIVSGGQITLMPGDPLAQSA